MPFPKDNLVVDSTIYDSPSGRYIYRGQSPSGDDIWGLAPYNANENELTPSDLVAKLDSILGVNWRNNMPPDSPFQTLTQEAYNQMVIDGTIDEDTYYTISE